MIRFLIKCFDQYSNKDSSRNSGNYKSVSWSNGKFPIGNDIRSYKGISSKLNWKQDQLISIVRRSIQLKMKPKYIKSTTIFSTFKNRSVWREKSKVRKIGRKQKVEFSFFVSLLYFVASRLPSLLLFLWSI